MAKQEVTNLGEALSVFVQIAELAQKRGVLSFDDAIIAKSAIDFVNELANQQGETQTEIAGVEDEVISTNETKSNRRSKAVAEK